MEFGWMALTGTRDTRYAKSNVFEPMVMSGGVFMIKKEDFLYYGGYDEKMTQWGGEHIEMSLRIWRCGGLIRMVPCSRIG
jgi:polypeptide N-acetylgalactosaminyltransferase